MLHKAFTTCIRFTHDQFTAAAYLSIKFAMDLLDSAASCLACLPLTELRDECLYIHGTKLSSWPCVELCVLFSTTEEGKEGIIVQKLTEKMASLHSRRNCDCLPRCPAESCGCWPRYSAVRMTRRPMSSLIQADRA